MFFFFSEVAHGLIVLKTPRADLFLVPCASQSNPAKAKLGMAPFTTIVAVGAGEQSAGVGREGGRGKDEKEKSSM